MVPQSSSNLQELCGLFGRSRPWLSSWHFNGFHHCWSSCVVLFLVILVNDDGHVHHMCVLGLYVSCFFFTPECDIVFTEKCSRFSKCCWFGVGALCLLVSTLVQLAHPNVIEVRLFFCGRVSWLYYVQVRILYQTICGGVCKPIFLDPNWRWRQVYSPSSWHLHQFKCSKFLSFHCLWNSSIS